MRIPTICGTIDRRILVNFRVDRSVLAAVLPKPFRPQLVGGYGIAGICLIRLRQIRPWFVPQAFGIGSENAAHRIAVEWDECGEIRQGVFVARRDTSSRLNTLAGGRLFPGVHHHSQFQIAEVAGRFRVALTSDDRQTHVSVDARIAAALPSTSVFRSLDECSTFFERGSLGYSPSPTNSHFDGLELRTFGWSVTPLAIDHVHSSYFDCPVTFPPGSATLDCALLMQNVKHEWYSRKSICCG
jgi:hypothetical protein